MNAAAVRIALAVVCFAGVPGGRAQSPAAPLEFDAVSIKQAPPSDGTQRVSQSVSMTGGHGRINYSNVTVRVLIRQAWGLQVYPLSTGASDPLSTDRYNVIAKASGDVSDEQTMQMLQAMLADRFKLKVHRETRELPVYALITERSGPKFREARDDGTTAEITGGGEGHPLKAHHVSMTLLANTLKGYVGHPVLDMTGLTGLYDLNLEFTSDENPDAQGTSIFTAVEEQLGLKLEARKGPVEIIVIDHVEKPSEN